MSYSLRRKRKRAGEFEQSSDNIDGDVDALPEEDSKAKRKPKLIVKTLKVEEVPPKKRGKRTESAKEILQETPQETEEVSNKKDKKKKEKKKAKVFEVKKSVSLDSINSLDSVDSFIDHDTDTDLAKDSDSNNSSEDPQSDDSLQLLTDLTTKILTKGEGYNNERYWEADDTEIRLTLEDEIIRSFKKKDQKIDKALLKEGVKASLKKIKSFIKEYSKVRPKDNSWKIGLTEEEISKYDPVLSDIRKSIKDDEPTMLKILSTPMLPSERKRLITVFDIYKNTDQYTFDKFYNGREIAKTLERCAKENVEDVELFEKDVKKILEVLPPTDSYTLKKRILGLEASDTIKARIFEIYQEMEDTPRDSTTYRELKSRVEWMVSLPYDKIAPPKLVFGRDTPEQINRYCVELRAKLDKELYGLDKVKIQLISFLVNKMTNPNAQASLALVGVQGVGKSSIAKVLAKAEGLPFERIPLGGIEDPTTLKGSDSHYLGSNPSILLQFLRNMKVSNGVVLFDEIDKINDRVKNALLHISDPSQNSEFTDAYLTNFPHNISRLFTIYALNRVDKLDPILRDRLYIIEIPMYTRDEVGHIIKDYLFPEGFREVGIPPEAYIVKDDGRDAILNMFYSHNMEKGVREIKGIVNSIIAKINLLRCVTLPNGTTGDLKLGYSIKNFSLPINIDKEIVERLVDPPKPKDLTYYI